MKATMRLLLCSIAVAFAQASDSRASEEKAKLERQNEALRSLLQRTPKLPLEETAIPGWPIGMVSWVAVDRSGLIHLLQRDKSSDSVVVLDRSGKRVRSWGKGRYETPHSIRIDPQGNVWTTDAGSSRVYQFSPLGKLLLTIEVGGVPSPRRTFGGTTDIAFAPNGHLFIADGYANARILEYTAQGAKVREWGDPGTGPGQFRLPHSIQIDERGVIYVADRENGRIQRFDLEGKYLGEWPHYGKTFSLKVDNDAVWLASIRRGPNGPPGWLIKVDRDTGALLGYVDTIGTHGVDVTPAGEVFAASPAPGRAPLFYRPKN